MFVKVDLLDELAEVGLEEADDCTRFHVAVAGHGHAGDVDQRLRQAGAGAVDGDGDALLSADWVRRKAAGVGADWDTRFADMLAYAAGQGWVSDDGAEIRAHLQWG